MNRFWRQKNGEKGISRVAVLLIALGAVVLALGGFLAAYLLGWTALITPGERRILNNDTFYEGVFVDGLPLAGLTRQEASSRVEAKQRQTVESNFVTVEKDGQRWQFGVSETNYSFDTEAVLDDAWQQGREGGEAERLAAIEQLRQAPVNLYTTIQIDPSALEQRVRDLALPFEKAPVDAAYLGYDVTKPDGERLSFSADVPGEHVDADALWAAVRDAFVNRVYGTVPLELQPVEAAVKLADLQERMKLVDRWNSVIKDHSKPRLANITIASAAISGRILAPGEVLSFNEATGQRTADKGYQVAHVINGGVTDNGLAGGVCQVSGTLWNVAVRADLEIAERTNHTLKSGYMKAGEDATVNWPNLDLKIRNNKEHPVLIILYVAVEKGTYKLYGEVYGVPLEKGVTIELKSERTKTVPAPSGPPRYVPSDAVTPGTTETNKARDGQYYTTYKLYLLDGEEFNRVKQHESYYPASGEVIVYNPVDGIPSPTPTPSPSPGPVQTPSPHPNGTSSPEDPAAVSLPAYDFGDNHLFLQDVIPAVYALCME